MGEAGLGPRGIAGEGAKGRDFSSYPPKNTHGTCGDEPGPGRQCSRESCAGSIFLLGGQRELRWNNVTCDRSSIQQSPIHSNLLVG